MKRNLFFLVVLTTMLFIGCKPTETPKADANLSVTTERIEFTSEGGEESIQIKSNTEWQIMLDTEASWLTASTLDGNNDATIKFTAAKNAELKPRSAKVQISANEKLKKEITVTQEAVKNNEPEPEPTLTLSPTVLETTPTGGEYKVNITCEREWSVLPYDTDWIEILPESGSMSLEINITTQRNTTAEPREVELIFQTQDKTGEQTLTIKQGAFDDSKNITIMPGQTNISYKGDEDKNGLKMWYFAIQDKKFIESNSIDGCTMEFRIASDNEYNKGIPTGDFTVNTSLQSANFANGDIANASYKNPADYYMTTLMRSGELSIVKNQDDNYKITGEFVAADDITINIDYTLDLNAEQGVAIKDESFNSDLAESYTQEISEVTIKNKGDIMGRGVNVWDITIWGDGATKGTEFINDSEDGTVTLIRFYTPTNQTTPEGNYPVCSSTYRYKKNTIEPGYEIAYAEATGTWIQFFKDWKIDKKAPAVEGNMSIKKNSDGSYSLSYEFKDDSPEPMTFKGEYNGAMDVIDIADTGDFDISKTMMYYAGDKYGANSWVMHLETKEFVSSGYKNGEVMEFILNVNPFDEFDMDFEKCEWIYTTDGNTTPYAINSGTITTYKNGEPTISKITGGKITNDIAWDNNHTYFIELVDITTENNSTYNMYHYCNLPREDITESKLKVVDITDFTVANLAYYGGETKKDYSNWQITLIDNSGMIFTILDLYLESSNNFEDGIPSGTYEFTKDNNEVGLWNTRNARITYYDEFTTFKDGSLTVEQLPDGKYNFTADFNLTDNEATLIGTIEGITANHIDNRVF